MAVEDSALLICRGTRGGWGIPSVLKRVAVLISAQIGWGTRVEERQVEHGVEGKGERMWETR